nr:unnamed protein product [Callosobruchus chinensis]
MHIQLSCCMANYITGHSKPMKIWPRLHTSPKIS